MAPFAQYIQVIIGDNIVSNPFGSQIQTTLRTMGVAIETTTISSMKGLISWKREIQQHLVQSNGEVWYI